MERARKVRVYNDNIVKNEKGEVIGYDLREQFKGKDVIIPPGGFVEMGASEAVHFKGQYHPIIKDGMNQQKAESYKIVRIVPVGKEEKPKQSFICNQDGTEHVSQDALDKHIAENFADDIQDQEFAQKFKKKVTKKKPA
jgi:hypothetical protein